MGTFERMLNLEKPVTAQFVANCGFKILPAQVLKKLKKKFTPDGFERSSLTLENRHPIHSVIETDFRYSSL